MPTSPPPLFRKLTRISVSPGPTPFLSTLLTSTAPYHPDTPPSLIFIPSQHPPTGRPREFSPPLTVAFNSVAKHYDATSAREMGLRRMLAVGGEEGGVRILDVDEGMGIHREEKGWWWRAHGNAIFDIKFSADDTKIVSSIPRRPPTSWCLSGPVDCFRRPDNSYPHARHTSAEITSHPSRSHVFHQNERLLRPFQISSGPFCLFFSGRVQRP